MGWGLIRILINQSGDIDFYMGWQKAYTHDVQTHFFSNGLLLWKSVCTSMPYRCRMDTLSAKVIGGMAPKESNSGRHRHSPASCAVLHVKHGKHQKARQPKKKKQKKKTKQLCVFLGHVSKLMQKFWQGGRLLTFLCIWQTKHANQFVVVTFWVGGEVAKGIKSKVWSAKGQVFSRNLKCVWIL